jgi:hypothetical protein
VAASAAIAVKWMTKRWQTSDLVGLAQLANLALQFVDALLLGRGQA